MRMNTVVPPGLSVLLPGWDWSTIVIILAQIESEEAALDIHGRGGCSTEEENASDESRKAHIKGNCGKERISNRA